MCQNLLNRTSQALFLRHPTLAVPLMCAFSSLSIVLTPTENLNIFDPFPFLRTVMLIVGGAVFFKVSEIRPHGQREKN